MRNSIRKLETGIASTFVYSTLESVISIQIRLYSFKIVMYVNSSQASIHWLSRASNDGLLDYFSTSLCFKTSMSRTVSRTRSDMFHPEVNQQYRDSLLGLHPTVRRSPR